MKSTYEFTDEEYSKIMKLIKLCKVAYFFQYDDLIIEGLKVEIVKRYIKLNPSKKFRIWLIDNYKTHEATK